MLDTRPTTIDSSRNTSSCNHGIASVSKPSGRVDRTNHHSRGDADDQTQHRAEHGDDRRFDAKHATHLAT